MDSPNDKPHLSDAQSQKSSREELKAGTGFMLQLSEATRHLADKEGYTANLSAKEDHFECNMGEFKLYPKDFTVDRILRFENSSDPDDNSILYAISDATQNIKGLYIESYGPQQDPLSREMIEKLKDKNNEAAH
ncbi:MAG: phosphoribosylpyrophosphate synthetase [Proteobacteria bacterium]|nr:MAG: phosphoribosylpyrophosphate synthetase [Pseudomonadota bacterium]